MASFLTPHSAKFYHRSKLIDFVDINHFEAASSALEKLNGNRNRTSSTFTILLRPTMITEKAFAPIFLYSIITCRQAPQGDMGD